MDRGDTTQGLGNPGENVDSYFHPLPSSLFSVQTRQALEIEGKFASSTQKRQSHLANAGSGRSDGHSQALTVSVLPATGYSSKTRSTDCVLSKPGRRSPHRPIYG